MNAEQVAEKLVREVMTDSDRATVLKLMSVADPALSVACFIGFNKQEITRRCDIPYNAFDRDRGQAFAKEVGAAAVPLLK